MTLAIAFLLPPGMLDSSSQNPGPGPSPGGNRLLWEDSAFIFLEDGYGYLVLE